MILWLLLLVSISSRADVSLRNGNFFHLITDLADTGNPSLKLERVYNSKSPYVGMFGLGWSNSWETYLDRDGVIHEWGGGLAVKGAALERESGRITRKLSDGGRQVFSETGYLVELGGVTPERHQYRLERNAQGLLVSVADEQGRSLRFRWGPIGRVTEISGSAGTARYRYDDRGMLVHFQGTDGSETSYQYDGRGRGNLSQILYPDGTTLEVEYLGADLFENVRSIKERDGAVTNYDYSVDRANPATSRVEVIETANARRSENRKLHEFTNPAPSEPASWQGNAKPALPSGVLPLSGPAVPASVPSVAAASPALQSPESAPSEDASFPAWMWATGVFGCVGGGFLLWFFYSRRSIRSR